MRGIMPVLLGLLAGAAALTLLGFGLVFIQPDERGVIVSPYDPKGYRANALMPGLHWIIPGENVVRYSVSRQTYTMSSVSGEGQVVGNDSVRARTKDGQEVYVDASVIYSIDPDQAVSLHINWQSRYEDGVVRAISRGTVRDAVSGYGVEEIVSTQRTALESQITESLNQQFGNNYLKLVQFVLRDIHFSEEYATAVEQKQIAQQQALQAAYVVQSKQQEAQQAIETAKGQAESVKIKAQGDADARLIQAEAEAQALLRISEALKNNPDLITYLYVNKLAPNVQVMYLPSGQPYLIPLPEAAQSPTVTTP